MEYNYDLSVIIPCHNLENFILPMLKSLEAQEFNYKIELIFICDACTDKTKNIIMKYSYNFLKYSAIHIISVDFHRLGPSRNRGLEIASGQFIIFLDGDDWLINNQAFQLCITSLIQNPDFKLLRFRWSTNQLCKDSWNCKDDKEISSVIFGTVWQYCYKKELINDLRFSNEQPGEDNEFTDAVLSKIKSYLWLDTQLYFYNFGRPGSNMQQFLEKGKID